MASHTVMTSQDRQFIERCLSEIRTKLYDHGKEFSDLELHYLITKARELLGRLQAVKHRHEHAE
jgi:hypothetical protein